MFWAADVNGRLASVTILHRADAEQGAVPSRPHDGAGPQIIAAVRALLRAVLQTKSGGASSYRIQANGMAACVQVEANPALSPDDGTFAGYIGSVHLVPEAAGFAEKVVDEDLARVIFLDAIADHVTSARTLASQAGERQLIKILDLALVSIGDQLLQAVED